MNIAFWVGHQLEPWTPETLERDGGGGAETMAWELSRRLARLGHDVTVYGHCDPALEARFDGVAWLDAARFRARPPDVDVLVVSRQADAVLLPHAARARVLWVHDVDCGDVLTPLVGARYDRVWCLSRWHRSYFLQVYPWLAQGKVELTRNGIDPARFAAAAARDPRRAVYSSSPDRGLVFVLRAWPAVRAQVPDAELHVYYGFESWERSLARDPDPPVRELMGAEALAEVRRLLDTTEGVVFHGRVNQRDLARAMLGAGVWVYPTWYHETSCITAMEAQAAGLVCVCPPLAALAETVADDARVWSGDLVSDVVAAMGAERVAGEGERFSLDGLAADWERRLRDLLE